MSFLVEDIKQFLAQIKGHRNVQLQTFFLDQTGFIQFVAQLRQQEAFSMLEVYRLKKLLTKAREIRNGTGVGGDDGGDDGA